MNRDTKKTIAYTTFIIFGLFLTYLPFPNAKTNRLEPKHIVRQNINVSQKISTKNKDGGFQEYKVDLGTTALELLKKEDKIKTKGKGKTAYITAIGEVEAEVKENEYWAFYINGKPSTVGAGVYVLKEGDKIEWKLEEF